MKHNLLAHLKIFLLLVLLGMGVEAMAVDYPAEYRVTTNLNIRKSSRTWSAARANGSARHGTMCWKGGRVVFLIAGAIILLLFWKQILEGIIFMGICMGIGSLITYRLFFDKLFKEFFE